MKYIFIILAVLFLGACGEQPKPQPQQGVSPQEFQRFMQIMEQGERDRQARQAQQAQQHRQSAPAQESAAPPRVCLGCSGRGVRINSRTGLRMHCGYCRGTGVATDDWGSIRE